MPTWAWVLLILFIGPSAIYFIFMVPAAMIMTVKEDRENRIKEIARLERLQNEQQRND